MKLIKIIVGLLILTGCVLKTVEIQSPLKEWMPNIKESQIIEKDEKDYLWVQVKDVDLDVFHQYCLESKEKFPIVVLENEMTFNSYNDKGQHIVLIYYEDEHSFSVEITESKIQKKLNWNTSVNLPIPNSEYGLIEVDNPSHFSATIQMDKSNYDEYVLACKEFGYRHQVNENETYYYAEDENGNDLYLHYLKADIVSIDLVLK